MKKITSKAIILAAGPNGLGAVRSLYKENVPVDIIVASQLESVLNSRLPIRKTCLKNGLDNDELLALLLSQKDESKVLIPTSDWFVNFLVRNKAVLEENYRFVLPAGDLSSHFIDKKVEVELVKNFTVLPKTIIELPENPEQLSAKLSLPMIIKPRSNELNRLGCKNIVIQTISELNLFYQQFPQALSFCIAQEVIEGDDENLWVCNCVFDYESNLVNAFTFQRLQLTPPHYGVTCYAKSQSNTEVIEQVKALGKGLNYVGPAMVEFKFDVRDGKYKYIEVNPRLGLCNYFDTSCGKNNVYATYCVAIGKPFIEQPQKNNRMFLSLYEDLYSRYRDGQKPIKILSNYFSNVIKHHTFMYFAWCDPWPALVMFYRQSKQIFSSILNKVK
tara:strand:- start:5303 stop:6466 length:1164 start_codon:yes stop_codon:yes gene_type:complete